MEDREERDAVEELEQAELPAEAQAEEEEPVAQVSRFDRIVELSEAALRGVEIQSAVDRAGELSDEERAALVALVEIVRGRGGDERLIYAEERLAQLNQVLAVLQPTLAVGLAPELAALRDGYDALVEDVSALRATLEKLVDAQAEMFAQDRGVTAEAPDTDDKPEPDEGAAPQVEPEVEVDDEIDTEREAPSTLYGKPGEPDEPEPPPKPSTVYEPDAG